MIVIVIVMMIVMIERLLCGGDCGSACHGDNDVGDG